jgi:O-antigen/teichoic acid export membrane protein
MKHSIVRASSINIILKFIALGLVFLFQSFLSKFISVEAYSIFAKFIIYSNYLYLLTSFGMTATLLYYPKIQKDFIRDYISILFLYCVIGVLLLSIFFLFEQNIFYILIVTFGLLLNLINISLSYFQFNNMFTKYALLSLLQAIGIVGVLAVTKIFNIQEVMSILKIYVSVHFLYFLFLLIIIFSKNLRYITFKIKYQIKYFYYGFKIVSLMLISQFIYITDFIMVDYFLDDKKLAYYFVALTISKMIFVIADTVGNIIFPLYAKANKKDRLMIDKNVYVISSLIFLVTIFMFISFCILGKVLLTVLYHQGYVQSYVSALLLIAGAQGMIIYKLLSRKFASEDSWITLYYAVIFAALVNIILNLILIPKYGINGAAFSSFIAYWVCGLSIIFLNKEGIYNFLFIFKIRN